MSDLYTANTLSRFWGLDSELRAEVWQAAIEEGTHLLPEEVRTRAQNSWDDIVELILGEGQFGPDHWQLSRAKWLYYDIIRLLLPRQMRPVLRCLLRFRQMNSAFLGWPVEDRYVRFLYAVLELVQKRYPDVRPAPFWPGDAHFAFVITHDVETAKGHAFVRRVLDLEQNLGFCSSFNFVPEGYRVDENLLDELRTRGFEIGVHGLNHDGKLFSSRAEFERRAERINIYLREWGAVGFRAPFVHRHPEWMQALEMEYDSSFFDTDPTQTIPGGTMSIWPFFCGRFVELPYTLAQDHILFEISEQFGPKLWLDKIDFIARWGGMALMCVHPDYMRDPSRLRVYETFLREMLDRAQRSAENGFIYYWHALPRDVARRWRQRAGL